MNPDLQNKLRKYEMLQKLLNSKPDITSRIIHFMALIPEFNNAIALINELSNRNIASKAFQQDIRSRLINITVDYAQKIQSYAIDKQKVFLQSATLLSFEVLDKLSTSELLTSSNRLYNIIEIHLNDLHTCSLNHETQIEYKTAILLSEKTLDNVNSFSIEDCFREADRILFKIEKRIINIRLEEPEFYSDFKAIVKLYQPPVIRIPVTQPIPTDIGCVTGKIVDDETNRGIPKVQLTFKIFAQQKLVRQINTLSNGSFHIESLQVGRYDVTMSHADYRTQTFSVLVTEDKDCVIKTSLKKPCSYVIPENK
jgi:hypothetical protein